MRSTFLLLLSVILFPSLAFAGFSDIKGHWGEEIIKEASEKGIINGYADGTFQPDKNVTLGEGLKIALYTMQGNDKNSPWNEEKYKEEGAWYNSLKNYWNDGENHLSDLKTITYGDDPMTRGEAMYIMLKSAGIDYEEAPSDIPTEIESVLKNNRDVGHYFLHKENSQFISPFLDVPPYLNYFPYIQLGYDLGIIDGYADQDFYGFKTFGTKSYITRSEITKISLNIKKLKEKEKLEKRIVFQKGFEGERVDYKNDEILSMYANEFPKLKNVIETDLKKYGTSAYYQSFTGRVFDTSMNKEQIQNTILPKLDRYVFVSKNMPKEAWGNLVLNTEDKYSKAMLCIRELIDQEKGSGLGISIFLTNQSKGVAIKNLEELKLEIYKITGNSFLY